jgi:HEAT repeat protein
MLQEILKKMLPHLVNSYETNASDDEIRDKMQTLLQEHQLEAYMPDGYMQGLLDALASGAIRAIEPAELDGLFNTLSLQFIDRRGSEIILQLVVADPAGEGTQELIQSLSDLCGHFLELGDYGQVLKILSQAADPRLPQPLRIAMRDSFCRRDFLDEILSGLTIWGKPKYDQVSLLIQVLGRAFIEPLLDRMAEEENMSLRRFIMDRVQSFGSTARPSIIHRLSDPRWYVLRNLIIMLRTLEPAQDVDLLRPLLRHPNQKVRVEALKSLLLIGDPQAQRQIVRDLESSDRETQLIAINMADRNSSAEMVRKLIFLVNSGGYTAVECELKAAAVHALGEIGRPEILPELAKVLAARSLLSFKALSRLKIEIIRSFERYPVAASIPLLQRLATGNDDVARQSAESLKNLRSKPS